MEDIDKLTKRIENVNNDDKVIKDWMIEDNSRWYVEELQDDRYLEGVESRTNEMIRNLLKHKVDYKVISNVSGKTVDEIKEIELSMKEE